MAYCRFVRFSLRIINYLETTVKKDKNKKLNILVTAFLSAFVIMMFSSGAFAASVPKASGQIDSYDGAILRKSASTNSECLLVLADNTKLKIHKEVFKSKTSTAAKKKWYYVTANGTNGYVRADLVDHIKYGSAEGKTTARVNYRKGAGTEMELSGTYKKGAKVSIVMKAKPVYSTRGTSSTWYKVKEGASYYYICSSKVKLLDSTSGAKSAQSTSTDKKETPDTKMTDNEFEKYMAAQGFPASY